MEIIVMADDVNAIVCDICGSDVSRQVSMVKEQLKQELMEGLEQRALGTLKGEMYRLIGEETVSFGKALTVKALLFLVGLIGLGILAWWKGNAEALKALLG